MSLSDLCDDLFTIIVKKIGDEDFRNLAPIIFADRRGRDIALSREILHSANISPLCSTPSKIFPGEDGRLFFTRCLEFENVTAIYYESLRLITREQDVNGSLSLLDTIVPTYAHATFAYAMFQMCAGRGDIAGAVFEFILDNHIGPLTCPIYSPVLEELGESLINTLFEFDPPCEETFGLEWEFASSESLSIPTCDQWHGEEFHCEGCYIYYCADRISDLL